MKIKTVTVTPKPREKFVIEETGEEFDTRARAKPRLKEIEEIKKSRGYDFIIAEHLFGYEWINYLGKNRLVSPAAKKQMYLLDDSDGKRDGAETDGILFYSMTSSGTSPPKYHEHNAMPGLIAALGRRGADVLFRFHGASVTCEITCGRKVAATITKPEDFYHDTWAMGPAIQKAAAEFLDPTTRR